ncbi:pyridoxamine 5'-phosphate oxidase family protein [Hwanghaeella grinnelliae]|nr:pyridoxamine 5'-phosphate oxidase family protein [Hwanghaeella grinnelliae]
MPGTEETVQNTEKQAPISDIAFTPAVKRQQESRGSRRGYARMENEQGWSNRIDGNVKAFVESRTSFYMATANGEGQPYIQHRGGPEGFLQVLDPRTLAFADYAGNRQYISTGNLTENDKVFLFLMDYQNRQRIKIWGTAKVIEDDRDLLDRLMPDGYRARPERAFVIRVEAWDANCPQHIPVMYPEAQVVEAIGVLQERIKGLEAELAAIRGDVPEG